MRRMIKHLDELVGYPVDGIIANRKIILLGYIALDAVQRTKVETAFAYHILRFFMHAPLGVDIRFQHRFYVQPELFPLLGQHLHGVLLD